MDSRVRTNLRTELRDVCECDVAYASGRLDSRRDRRRDVETGQRDAVEIADGDSPKADGDRSPRRGKTETSADGARSDEGGARTIDATAERIREERDDNSYRRKLGGTSDDKESRRDRRPVQRDAEEEAGGSRATAGKSWRAGGAEEGTTTKGTGVRDRESGSPYRRRRAEERRETRLPDSGARKIGRSDRAGERVGMGARRDGNGTRQLGRRENVEEKSVARDRKRAKADKDGEEEATLLSKAKDARVVGKRTTSPLDDAEKGRSVISAERELLAETDATKKWKGNECCRCALLPFSLSGLRRGKKRLVAHL